MQICRHRPMLVLAAAGVFVAGVSQVCLSQSVELPEPVSDVTLRARYEPEHGRICGTERLSWHNRSSVPIDELRFHLYLNAFKNNRSTFVEEAGATLRGDEMPEGEWGWIEVTSMRIVGGADLTHDAQFIAPDDGNAEDRTLVRYPLADPLGPGEWIELDIDFESHLPGIFARTGVQGDYVLAGQWFPKICVLEKAGERGREQPGWNSHQYHGYTEYYADFGNYDVTLTLPERYRGKIAATGRMLEQAVENGEVTARFVQHGVHDFAWGADPRFILIEQRFEPGEDVPSAERERFATLLGVDETQLALPPIDISLFLQPAHRSQADRYVEAAKAAIRGYGWRLGAYPYETFTMVDPPRGASGSAGMEYPTFVTVGTHVGFDIWPFDGVRLPENVVVHEYGHQYWQGMVANNEFEEAWIDEGINTFYETIVMDETYEPGFASLLGLEVSDFDLRRAPVSGGRFSGPVVQPGWTFRSFGAFARNSFMRPALTLAHLEGLLGHETFHRAMRGFFESWRFRHPSTADFERWMNESSGQNLDWFFEQALHSTRALDYSIRRATSTEREPAQGWFGEGDSRRLVSEDEESSGDVQDETDPTETGSSELGEIYRSVIEVYRKGEFRHPVTVELVFDDGHVERREWDGADRWMRWTIDRRAKLVSAEVDPDGWMVLDVDRLNNSYRLEAEEAPRRKLLIHLLFWLQNLFEATAFLG
ncbi:MAG: M1 family metallopeptidase [Acidobacteriota bacterium]|nr:MAG: M1 family metallopeptidase [Acidobacteriota bacterium]